ncbi:hypothetical protein ACTODO_00511 [Schaalia dentiphila ATCC 17982]|nr:hypothetical protein ACTODO_00511 [Schaalia odontolytica ATCC 17982]
MRGSSPLTRGKPAPGWVTLWRARLIPAHAGKTPSRSRTWPNTQAHPRSRGENGARDGVDPNRGGSSPLTRGKPPARVVSIEIVGLIPAHAGKTSSQTLTPCPATAHPRSRGEN